VARLDDATAADPGYFTGPVDSGKLIPSIVTTPCVYSSPTSPARGVPSRPTQTTLKMPDLSPNKGCTVTCIPTLSAKRVFSFAPNLLSVTIRASSWKGPFGNVPEILTGQLMFTRPLRRDGSELLVFPIVHLPECFAGWASGSRKGPT